MSVWLDMHTVEAIPSPKALVRRALLITMALNYLTYITFTLFTSFAYQWQQTVLFAYQWQQTVLFAKLVYSD